MSDENKYSIGIASGYYTETEVAELEAEIAHLTAERGRLRERMSNHCCCEFAADGETFVKRCKVHADIARERDKLREALRLISRSEPLPQEDTAAVAACLGDVLYAAELPRPLSVNRLYHNGPKLEDGSGKRAPKGRGKARSYRDWIKAAGQALVAQGRRPALAGPVGIVFHFGEEGASSKSDLDNLLKAPVDLLVSHGVIPDDNRHILRHVCATWVPGAVCRVFVHRWIG